MVRKFHFRKRKMEKNPKKKFAIFAIFIFPNSPCPSSSSFSLFPFPHTGKPSTLNPISLFSIFFFSFLFFLTDFFCPKSDPEESPPRFLPFPLHSFPPPPSLLLSTYSPDRRLQILSFSLFPFFTRSPIFASLQSSQSGQSEGKQISSSDRHHFPSRVQIDRSNF